MQRAATLSFSHFPHTMEGPSYLLSQHVHKHARPCMQQRDPRASAPCKASQPRPNAPRDKAWRARFASCDTVKCKASGPLPKPTITAYGKLDKLVDPDLPGRGPWVSVGPKRGWEHEQGGVRVDGVAAHRPHMSRRRRVLDDCGSRAAGHQLARRLLPRSVWLRCSALHRHAPGGGAAGKVAATRRRSSSAREQPRASLKRVKLLGKVVFSTDFSREVEPDRLDSAHLCGGEHDLGLVPCVPWTKPY